MPTAAAAPSVVSHRNARAVTLMARLRMKPTTKGGIGPDGTGAMVEGFGIDKPIPLG